MTGRDWSGYRVGLTGGIASGKSLVAGLFAALGVPVIDADEFARTLVQPGSAVLAEITAEFGPRLLLGDGSLDRRRLRDIAFADPAARARLERILHPRILAAMEAAADVAGGPYQLLVVPLLFEARFAGRVDRALVVDCPESLQRARLLARDHETPEGVEHLLAAQLSRAERLAGADDVLVNAGNPADARKQVARLHARYLSLAGRHGPADTD